MQRAGKMTSAVKVKPGFKLAELDLQRRLADEASYQQKLRKLQIAMLELEQIYRVERPAEPGGARPPLSLAVLSKAAASRPDCHLRPQLVRPGARRTRRGPGATEGVAARL